MTNALVRWWLDRQRGTTIGEAAVLRGSQLTAQWVPGRVANDLDFLLGGEWSLDTVTAALESMLGGATDVTAALEGIWLETPWPGMRVHLRRGDESLQVDVGWGDPFTVAPRPCTLEGVTLPGVTPELMLGWKTHSLVERGPRGRWHPKTLVDLVIISRHVPHHERDTARCVREAFTSHQMSVALLDGFLHDDTWGLGHGSKGKWKKYARASPWVTFELETALAEARTRVAHWLSLEVTS